MAICHRGLKSLTRMHSRATSIRIFVLLLVWSVTTAAAQRWQPLGPDGGSVRSLTMDPGHPERIFLGTSAGRLYLSEDSGASWIRLAQLGAPAEMVLDHIVVDPSNPYNIYIAAWNAQAPNSDGDVFRSRDGGKTWNVLAGVHGKSVRALALAPSDASVLVAGALDGVFRSRDHGDTWERISPENHAELRTVESVAIDPANPDVIYAGTWHLPWKTEDGGKNWHSIKKGVIDDSDVFSIVIDSANPANLYISACSGIYRSDSAGELFQKIQGIPYAARRTRSLRMDPADHKVVYAGTTEGLWKTTDAGATWKRMTGASVVVNDVVIDPRQPTRVLLATDRGGVLASNDGGTTFVASNRGFAHRQVAALLVDRSDSSLVFAGVLNDKEFGGAFASRDAGRTWKQVSEGLDGRDVLVLRQASNHSVVAGTDRGIFLLQPNSSRWLPINNLGSRSEAAAETGPRKEDKPLAVLVKTSQSGRRAAVGELSARVTGLEVGPERWFATTAAGFMVSADSGSSWRRVELPGIPAVTAVAASEKMLVAAGRNSVAVSVNGGESWLPAKPLYADFTVNAVAVETNGNIWLAAREGVFRSTDLGDSWKRISSLRLADVATIQFDEANQRILATSAASNSSVFESLDNGRTWTQINSGWPLRGVSCAHGRLLGWTPFDGVVIQPETSASGSAYLPPR
jgi:photosystem II stability/assembly factor-like uncharacterized protein